MATREPPKRNNFDRFVYFFSGVAIGCVMLGIYWQMKSRSMGPGSAQGGASNAVVAPGAGGAGSQKTQTTP